MQNKDHADIVDKTEKRYNPGDQVIAYKIPNAPAMVVKELARERTKPHNTEVFLGLICYWFTSDGHYQEQLFHAKDLREYDRV